MSRLSSYYDRLGAVGSGKDFLSQVGHTINGRPISDDQFRIMVADICAALQLESGDRVLDVCCGNGVVTQHLAAFSHAVVGVDFSGTLIDVAREHHQPDNTQYHVLDALQLDRLAEREPAKFNKVLLHGSLQHFRHDQFDALLSNILQACTPQPLVLISYILEKSKSGLFFNTPRRKLNRVLARLRGYDALGTWWSREQIAAGCARLGRTAAFPPIDDRLQVAHYRFNAKIT